MPAAQLLRRARRRAGLTSRELAELAGTQRTAISAYETGRKVPNTDTLERLVEAAGAHLDIAPKVRFAQVVTRRGKPVPVPDQLPQLPPARALADITLPTSVAWSGQQRHLRLSNRRERIAAYRALLSEGTARDIAEHVDGNLLLDAWDDLMLPREVEQAWQPVIDRYRAAAARPEADG